MEQDAWMLAVPKSILHADELRGIWFCTGFDAALLLTFNLIDTKSCEGFDYLVLMSLMRLVVGSCWAIVLLDKEYNLAILTWDIFFRFLMLCDTCWNREDYAISWPDLNQHLLRVYNIVNSICTFFKLSLNFFFKKNSWEHKYRHKELKG